MEIHAVLATKKKLLSQSLLVFLVIPEGVERSGPDKANRGSLHGLLRARSK